MILAAIITWPGCKKEPVEKIQPEQYPDKSSQSQPSTEKTDKPSTDTTISKMTLKDVLRSAKTWGPAYKPWSG